MLLLISVLLTLLEAPNTLVYVCPGRLETNPLFGRSHFAPDAETNPLSDRISISVLFRIGVVPDEGLAADPGDVDVAEIELIVIVAVCPLTLAVPTAVAAVLPSVSVRDTSDVGVAIGWEKVMVSWSFSASDVPLAEMGVYVIAVETNGSDDVVPDAEAAGDFTRHNAMDPAVTTDRVRTVPTLMLRENAERVSMFLPEQRVVHLYFVTSG